MSIPVRARDTANTKWVYGHIASDGDALAVAGESIDQSTLQRLGHASPSATSAPTAPTSGGGGAGVSLADEHVGVVRPGASYGSTDTDYHAIDTHTFSVGAAGRKYEAVATLTYAGSAGPFSGYASLSVSGGSVVSPVGSLHKFGDKHQVTLRHSWEGAARTPISCEVAWVSGGDVVPSTYIVRVYDLGAA